MSDRPWLSLHEELEQQQQSQQQQPQEQEQPHLHHQQQPITLPLFQAAQHQSPYHHHSMASVSAHLQAAASSTYQPSSLYPGLDPALAAGYYHHQYGQGYGSAATAFRFPSPHDHFQSQQAAAAAAAFSMASRPGGLSSAASDAAAARSTFQRTPRLHHLGRTFSSPEMPTPPPTFSAAAFSAPASAGLFPPPLPPPNGHHHVHMTSVSGSSGSASAVAERTTSAGATATVPPFFDPYYASVSGFFFQHHHQQQQQQHHHQQHTPSPSHSDGHSPSIHGGLGMQSMPMLSPFGYAAASGSQNFRSHQPLLFSDTTFVFQPHPGSPGHHLHHHHQQQGIHAGHLGGQHQQQMICAVCGDTAACLHYGVRTCEGCKGFFKRTVQKNAKYVCLGNRDCVIDKRRRNRCQFCRFQKCLNVGMVREVVRTDSLKGRRGRLPSKSKVPGSGDQEAGPSGGASGGAMVVAQSLTKALINAYTGGNGAAGPGSASMPSTAGASSVRHGSSEHFVDSLRSSLQAVHQYAERIPGWTSLVEQDRIRLLKRFGVRALAIRWAYRSMAVCADEKLLTDDGLVFTLAECPLAWQTWFQSVLALSAHFRTPLELDLTSFSCLCALSLVFQECNGLQRVEEVDKLKNNIINCLKEHCAYSSEAKTKPQYFARILAVQTDLNTISAYAKQAYALNFGHSIGGGRMIDEDQPSTSAALTAPLSLTFFDESFLD